MKLFAPSHVVVLITILGLLFSTASVAVEVLEAESSFLFWVLYGSSHGPCVGADWTHEVWEGTSFDLHTTNMSGSCVDYNWLNHCDETGILYSGEFLSAAAGYYGFQVAVENQISVLISLSTPTIIHASRTVSGDVSTNLHTVTALLQDGSTEVLLGEDGTVNSREILLSPGIVRLTFSIDSFSTLAFPFGYSGLVEVRWDNTTGASTQSWDRIKSLYRQSQ